jgi:phage gpG-like protein
MTAREFSDMLTSGLARMKEELPLELALASRDYFAQSFDNQGFGGASWEERRGDYDWPILVKSGQLKSDVENADISASWEQTTITVNNDYAVYHNEGTSRLPQREFVGVNDELGGILIDVVTNKLTEIFE